MKAYRKPDRDKLDQYIYDYGFDEALEIFGLTDKQAERILFDAPVKRVKPNDNIEQIIDIVVELDFTKIIPLLKVMKANYSKLRKHYLKSRDLNKINIRAETPEDKFHNALIKILEDSDRFEYRGEKETLSYITTRLYWEHNRAKKTDQRDKAKPLSKITSLDQLDQLINNLKDNYNG